MKSFPKLPNPHPDHAGRNFIERAANEAFARIAKRWQPSGEENETTHSTVSRYTQYLIDRLTGKAYSADELLSRPITAADITDPENIVTNELVHDAVDGDFAVNVDVIPSANTAGTPAFAFAFQRVVSGYSGACIKVRRSSDNAELDIGFNVDGTLDTVSLLEHCGSGDGFIRTWYDQSGNSRDLQQSTTTKQFQIVASGVVVTSKGQPACDVVRASSQNMATSAFDLTGTTAALALAAFVPDDTTTGIVWDHGAPYTNGGFGINVNQFGTNRIELIASTASAATRLVNYTTSTAGIPQSVACVLNPSRSTSDDRGRIRVNSSDVDESNTAVVSTLTTGCFVNDVLTVGSNKSAAGYFDGKIQMIAAWSSLPTQEKIAAVETQAMRASGQSTPYVASATTYDLSREQTVEGDFIRSSSFAAQSWETTATILKVRGYNDIYSNFPTMSRIGVFVDGVYNQNASYSANGLGSTTVYLPAGKKTITLLSGGQSNSGGPGNPVLGTWPISISANAPMTRATVSSASPLLIYGDSIAVGGNCTNYATDPWALKIRSDAPYPVSLEAWGWRALHDDCSDSTARAAFVAKIVAWNPSKLWLAIGTNDYGLNRWSAASFGTAYAALLTDLHTALPSLQIYAQTPLLRTTETANGSGSTLGNYRTQITSAASGKSYVTLVDGTAIMTTASLDDGVHPTTAGHALYYNYVKAVLGI